VDLERCGGIVATVVSAFCCALTSAVETLAEPQEQGPEDPILCPDSQAASRLFPSAWIPRFYIKKKKKKVLLGLGRPLGLSESLTSRVSRLPGLDPRMT
jgi:hypothetical protein